MPQGALMPEQLPTASGATDTTARGEVAGQAREYAVTGVSTTGETQTLTEMAKGYVQQNPGQAMLLSAALGLVVALLLPGDPYTDPD